jgi:hypothetical protein
MIFDVALGPTQLAPGKVDAADHHREHVVEVVRDAAGQCPIASIF